MIGVPSTRKGTKGERRRAGLFRRRGKRGRKYGRNKVKCANYRARVGKPNGPGKPGRKT